MTPDERLGPRSDASLSATPTGTIGGRYRVERQLGMGGMATVYQATDLKHNRSVALKVMRSDLYDSLGAQRFLREITIAANLTHPHILALHDSGEVDGVLYYVMPFIDGPTLRAKLRMEGRLSIPDVVRILRDVADALGAAHAHGVVHRDIKPENIMMLGRSAVVADFGIAKALTAVTGVGGTLTATGLTAGTPAYMAPEQVAADPNIDHRADFYALGVVAYELLTGSTPFAGRTPTQLAAAILTEEPPPLALQRSDAPPALTSIVMRLLAKDPMSRPASASEVMSALDGVEVSSPSVPAQSAARRALGGWRGRAALAAGVTVVVAAGVLLPYKRAETLPPCGTAALDSLWAGGNAKSVVVFPFLNTSGDTANERFSDGLTDAVTSALGRVCGLRVASQSSVFPLKGKGLTVPEIGKRLGGYASVIDGSARRDGGRIHVNVRLVRASDDQQLWQSDYDRQSSDVFAVQADIADAIVSALHARSSGMARSVLVIPTRDSVAYELYLRGKYDADSRDSIRWKRAVQALGEATQRDTSFALAFAALADVYTRGTTHRFMPLKQVLPLADVAANRALALNPELAEGHAAKGFVLSQRGSLAPAESALRRAIQLNRSYLWAHHFYSLLLAMEGRVDEGVRETEFGLLLDPRFPMANAHMGVLRLMKGDRAGARQALEKAMPLDSAAPVTLYYLGAIEAAEGNFAKALTYLERAHKFPEVRATLVYVYSRLGRRKEADAILASLRDDAVERALGDAMMGNVDRAFATLEGLPWDDPDKVNPVPTVINLRATPLLAPLRADPRYPALLRRMGFSP